MEGALLLSPSASAVLPGTSGSSSSLITTQQALKIGTLIHGRGVLVCYRLECLHFFVLEFQTFGSEAIRAESSPLLPPPSQEFQVVHRTSS